MSKKKQSKSIIGKYMPYYYAGASLDFNLIHIDQDYAKANGLPGIILQGMCTMALTAKHLIDNGNPAQLRSIKVRFLNPVLPEDELVFDSVTKGSDVSVIVKNQNGGRVLKGKATLK